MTIEVNGKTYYHTAEACKLAGISRTTLFRWLKANIIKDVNHTDRRGWRLFTDKDIAMLKQEASKISTKYNS